MSVNTGSFKRRLVGKPYRIVKERLNDNNTYLLSFLFHQGGNIYVFSYKKEGTVKYTLIDAGDLYYRNQILSILIENEVNPVNIEKIIITHRHTDHSGLAALLAQESKAKILVHSNFKSFIEGDFNPEERRRFGDFDPQQLKKCDIEYLSNPGGKKVRNIGGVDFISLVESIEVGETGRLEILASPESTPTHTPDQLIVLYSIKDSSLTDEKRLEDLLPTSNILFSGDLWLMTGPIYYSGIKNIYRRLRYYFFRIRRILSTQTTYSRNPREQDVEEKEALKRGFTLIKVKPGHGNDFIGSRIIPNGLLADRDIIVKLGYPENTNKSILRQRDLAHQITVLKEEAYASFVKELHTWLELGYNSSDISSLLTRIYKEQTGGSRRVKKDRKQRRKRLKETLVRLRNDEAESDELNQLAESTLSAFKGIN